MNEQTLVEYDEEKRQLICSGTWNIFHLSTIKHSLDKIKWPNTGEVIIDGKFLHQIDSAGAWILIKLQAGLTRKKLRVSFIHFSKASSELIAIVKENKDKESSLPRRATPDFLTQLGKNTVKHLSEFSQYLSFVGQLTFETIRLTIKPIHWRWNALSSIIFSSGYQGLPIIALLSFLIGVVLTYQMGLQLKNYGANIYIVDLLGLSILREFAPLITAIMVAGRTGSAFTASLGMMKLNQEIDALNVLGVTPAELLIIPRIIGLFISLPLLTMWSDIFGVLGGMVMSNNQLSITWFDFLHRFAQVIPLRSFLIGIGKAPIFALIIASIGCFQGMKVKNSAESVGQNTTRSVVLSIFFIIVADAIFSIIFSKLKL